MSSLGILVASICFGVGFAIAFWIKGIIVSQKVKAAEAEASHLLEDSRRQAETLLKEADLEVKDRIFKMKSDFDAETKETRSELKKRETRLMQKEENVDRKIEQYEQKDHELQRKEKILKKRENEIERQELNYQNLLEEQKQQLEKICGLSAEQAKELLIRAMENEARYEGARLIKKMRPKNKPIEKPKRFWQRPSSAMPESMWPSGRFRWFRCPAMK
jgi:ribonuclease Y